MSVKQQLLVDKLNQHFLHVNPENVVVGLRDYFPSSNIAFSTSLSAEDQLITHFIFANDLRYNVFTLDTGRLFTEVYALLSSTQRKYNCKIRVYYPNFSVLEAFVSDRGINSFYDSVENRKKCCEIRKIEPLNRALKGIQLWITGLRQEIGSGRENISLFEIDEKRNIIKCNPLNVLSFREVLHLAKKNNVEICSLHHKGFKSIGCSPCTRAVQDDEPVRSGRWWWEQQSATKECGLHTK